MAQKTKQPWYDGQHYPRQKWKQKKKIDWWKFTVIAGFIVLGILFLMLLYFI
jgi:uncharacterized iron-regulated membrane protein